MRMAPIRADEIRYGGDAVILDTTDARRLAEFRRQLPGFGCRPGDEPPEPGRDDERGRDWLVLLFAMLYK